MTKEILDNSPGELLYIPKTDLHIDHTYQRPESADMVRKIARSWSWVGCGVIIVAKRKDNTYIVLDGQHRVLAARTIPTINLLPCIVFYIGDIKEEAYNFILSNTMRRIVTSHAKYTARLVSEDSQALELQSILDRYGIRPTKNGGQAKSLSSISTSLGLLAKNKQAFTHIIEFCSLLCQSDPIIEPLLKGLYFIDTNLITGSIVDEKFKRRALQIGYVAIIKSIKDSTIMAGHYSDEIAGHAILKVMNLHLSTNKFILKP